MNDDHIAKKRWNARIVDWVIDPLKIMENVLTPWPTNLYKQQKAYLEKRKVDDSR